MAQEKKNIKYRTSGRLKAPVNLDDKKMMQHNQEIWQHLMDLATTCPELNSVVSHWYAYPPLTKLKHFINIVKIYLNIGEGSGSTLVLLSQHPDIWKPCHTVLKHCADVAPELLSEQLMSQLIDKKTPVQNIANYLEKECRELSSEHARAHLNWVLAQRKDHQKALDIMLLLKNSFPDLVSDENYALFGHNTQRSFNVLEYIARTPALVQCTPSQQQSLVQSVLQSNSPIQEIGQAVSHIAQHCPELITATLFDMLESKRSRLMEFAQGLVLIRQWGAMPHDFDRAMGVLSASNYPRTLGLITESLFQLGLSVDLEMLTRLEHQSRLLPRLINILRDRCRVIQGMRARDSYVYVPYTCVEAVSLALDVQQPTQEEELKLVQAVSGLSVQSLLRAEDWELLLSTLESIDASSQYQIMEANEITTLWVSAPELLTPDNIAALRRVAPNSRGLSLALMVLHHSKPELIPLYREKIVEYIATHNDSRSLGLCLQSLCQGNEQLIHTDNFRTLLAHAHMNGLSQALSLLQHNRSENPLVLLRCPEYAYSLMTQENIDLLVQAGAYAETVAGALLKINNTHLLFDQELRTLFCSAGKHARHLADLVVALPYELAHVNNYALAFNYDMEFLANVAEAVRLLKKIAPISLDQSVYHILLHYSKESRDAIRLMRMIYAAQTDHINKEVVVDFVSNSQNSDIIFQILDLLPENNRCLHRYHELRTHPRSHLMMMQKIHKIADEHEKQLLWPMILNEPEKVEYLLSIIGYLKRSQKFLTKMKRDQLFMAAWVGMVATCSLQLLSEISYFNVLHLKAMRRTLQKVEESSVSYLTQQQFERLCAQPQIALVDLLSDHPDYKQNCSPDSPTSTLEFSRYNRPRSDTLIFDGAAILEGTKKRRKNS